MAGVSAVGKVARSGRLRVKETGGAAVMRAAHATAVATAVEDGTPARRPVWLLADVPRRKRIVSTRTKQEEEIQWPGFWSKMQRRRRP